MATKRITQKALSRIVKQRTEIESLQKRLEQDETAVFESLKAGATVQTGVLLAEVKVIERRNVAWRQKFEVEIDKRDGDGKGVELADRILAATKPQTYESLSIKTAA
jgi:hypothetical protein